MNTTIEENPMSKRFISCLLTILFLAGLALAHGDPIMGTVTAVANDRFTIKDRKNQLVVIMVEKATKYIKTDKPVTKSDLQVGLRVIIDAHMDTKMKMYSAEEVTIGTAAPSAAAKK